MLTRLTLRNPFHVGRAAIRRPSSGPRFLSANVSSRFTGKRNRVPFRRRKGTRFLFQAPFPYTPIPMPPVATPWREAPSRVRPMLAVAGELTSEANLLDDRVIFEPKYDGIRAIVMVEPAAPTPRVAIYSRNGNEKTAQFPEVVRELRQLGQRLDKPVIFDGEIVALDERDQPAGFERLQGRMHLTGTREIDARVRAQPAALLLFDLLRDGGDDLRGLQLTTRRARLDRLLATATSPVVRLGSYTAGDGRRLYREAEQHGLEGLILKRADSRYESGRRSTAWRKIKILRQQEVVIGGWTEPRGARVHMGALLMGVWVDDRRRVRGSSARADQPLLFVGAVGTGFSDTELGRLSRLLASRATEHCPFVNEQDAPPGSHWVKPEMVVQVRFAEWTDDRKLRHPVYLGVRDDKAPHEVGIEPLLALPLPLATPTERQMPETANVERTASRRGRRTGEKTSGSRRTPRGQKRPPAFRVDPARESLVSHLQALEESRRDGTLALPGGQTLDVTNLAKVFWPQGNFTKGDLLRYYVRISPWLLPVVDDRPLVMKRFPNGVNGKAFYQQRAPDEAPPGVRVDVLEERSDKGVERTPRLVGGTLETLLYMAQLAAISQDPWFSRVSSPESADFAAIDLDPMPGASFADVLDVARWVHEELESIGVPGVPKTSGSRGLHIYLPLPPGTSYHTGQLLCRIIATLVATKHPKQATVERQVSARGRTVYVDYLQNILGKTLASAYSVRATAFAGVSTPLAWDELDDGVAPEDFTLTTVEARFRRVGDLWASLRTTKPPDMRTVLDRLGSL
ncbi:MAG: DNA ligase D [Luteitalea sp.]|nr:DNA ligase D [Luteitalea sp.]